MRMVCAMEQDVGTEHQLFIQSSGVTAHGSSMDQTKKLVGPAQLRPGWFSMGIGLQKSLFLGVKRLIRTDQHVLVEKQRVKGRLPMNFSSSFECFQGLQIIFLALKTFWTYQRISPLQLGIENANIRGFFPTKSGSDQETLCCGCSLGSYLPF